MKNDKILYSIKIEIKAERYYNFENCYGIYTGFLLESDKPIELQPLLIKNGDFEKKILSTESLMVIKGNTCQLIPGNIYELTCNEEIHAKYGQQFNIHNIQTTAPTTDSDEQEFIQNLVTERQYINILKIYSNPITQILNNTFDYTKIDSFSLRSFNALKKKVENNISTMQVKNALADYKLTFNQCKQLLKTYHSSEIAIQKVKDNPYTLYIDVDGFGFKTVDSLALSSGIAHNDPRRILAAIQYIIRENENRQSHCYSYIEDVKNKLLLEFNVPVDTFDELTSNERLFYKDELRIARRSIYNCELVIAQELKRLSDKPVQYSTTEEVTEYITSIEDNLNIQYDEKQKELFYAINSNNVVVFTGSAGTGKTTTLNGTLDMLDSLDKTYLLMSPTARAAKQMTKSTNRKASTIHRALGIIPGEDENENTGTIEADIIIIDEISMVDIFIFKRVLHSIRNGSKLLLVGDYAQLESVQIGNVLFDIMNSNTIPVVKLDKVFRQALDSGILNVATKVRYGEDICNGSSETFTYGVKGDCNIWLNTKESAVYRLMVIYRDCIENGTSPDDIMVLSPTKKSNSGVHNLNSIIQLYVNPQSFDKNEITVTRDGRTFIFREGDKVMHTKNNYQAEWLDKEYEYIINHDSPTGEPYKGVFNGDIGIIIQIDPKTRELYVDYGDYIIEYNTIESLDLAYCSTIHKAQGGSALIVIMVVTYEHFINLKRSLLYTGITRASEEMYIIGELTAVKYAISNDVMVKKQTFLTEMLQNEFNKVTTIDNDNITLDNSNISIV